ncbi:hypothetical protein D3C73_1508650 [compost metagenome]
MLRSPCISICRRQSGPQSIARKSLPLSISTEERSRAFRPSVLASMQVSQLQYTRGTPMASPVPKNTSVSISTLSFLLLHSFRVNPALHIIVQIASRLIC